MILGSGMTTHSGILTWRILGPEEPGRLQSLGSQRVSESLAVPAGQVGTELGGEVGGLCM